jgi:hypothetical protein
VIAPDEDRACRRARHRLLLAEPEAEVVNRPQPRVMPSLLLQGSLVEEAFRSSSSAQWLMS